MTENLKQNGNIPSFKDNHMRCYEYLNKLLTNLDFKTKCILKYARNVAKKTRKTEQYMPLVEMWMLTKYAVLSERLDC